MEKTLVRIVSHNRDNTFCHVTPIKDYTRITRDATRFYCGPDPVSYTELDNRVFSARLDEIGRADLKKAVAILGGHYYRIETKNIIKEA